MLSNSLDPNKTPSGFKSDFIDNPIIFRVIQQPSYTPMDVRYQDSLKKEVYNQMREHKSSIQIFQTNETQQKIIDEHDEIFTPKGPRAQSAASSFAPGLNMSGS